ncbi:predicted membrane-associated HD superfamily hydrolase [Moorella thermoacetica Y72]|uniref:Predicted membrane-associated HD superfamily hydrolase n=1 Tax=Moorella thermoacetica Y72 TaxID=1325331 RepID=A0A0S6UF01_NEOTH|nr:HDIG domain-containing metalloprotein [Moorella thermoacetica]GAF26323.1 predicted membrane-associated HD superfamily hydrolase [Moorella thermoacetica Y72]
MPWQRLETLLHPLLARLGPRFLTRRAVWGMALFVIAVAIMALDFLPQKLELTVGQPSPRDFKAPQGIVYESEVLTQKAREEAARQVAPVYRVDNTVVASLTGQVDSIFQSIREINNSTGDANERVARLKERLNQFKLAPAIIQALATADSGTINNLATATKSIINQVMGEAVPQDALNTARDKMLAAVETSGIDARYRPLVAALLRELDLKPNLIYDVAATMQKQEKARAEVVPVQVTIRQGEKIVSDGELVTAEDIEALQKLGLLRTGTSWGGFIGLILFQGILVALMLLYLRFFKPDIYGDNHLLLLLGLLWLIFLVFSRGVVAISLGGRPDLARLVGYLMPVAAGSMLVAILLDVQVAVIFTVFLGLEAGIISGNYYQFAAAGFISGLTGIYCVAHLSHRSDLARSSLFLMLANLLSVVALGLMLKDTLFQLSIAAGLALANGLLSTVLTIGFLPFLENSFGITTAVKLLELSDPNHPLLKRLLLEAPGTYHHSILVGNLAEAAANAVGADSLLARVGAYYHDIGKLKRPYFFIENQVTPENPHDRLAPTLSTLIISCHVKDGLEMAREFHLPRVIQDIIAQHHGATLMSYFYHKACENSRDEKEVAADDFRYEGPKPQSKEAAIVMLADSVEAGIRSLPKATPGRMEGFIRKIIKEKLEDNQLEASDLTFRELTVIAEAFMRVLNGIFHTRVEYPEVVVKEMERRKNRNGVLHKQSAG